LLAAQIFIAAFLDYTLGIHQTNEKENNLLAFLFEHPCKTNNTLSSAVCNRYLVSISFFEFSLCKRYKLPLITLHGLRHSCASVLFAAGVELGHAHIETTMNIITHLTSEIIKKTFDFTH